MNLSERPDIVKGLKGLTLAARQLVRAGNSYADAIGVNAPGNELLQLQAVTQLVGTITLALLEFQQMTGGHNETR